MSWVLAYGCARASVGVGCARRSLHELAANATVAALRQATAVSVRELFVDNRLSTLFGLIKVPRE